MWKIYYEGQTIVGGSREDWDAAPVAGVQVLMVKGPLSDGRSRVGYYQKERDRSLFSDHDYYAWVAGEPAGVTPDAVLDLWAQRTNDTGARVGDLSLEDLHATGVKLGRSIEDEKFHSILTRALNDPDIP